MDVQFSDHEITPHQAAVARSIEEVVQSVATYRRTTRESIGNGPSVEIVVQTTDPALAVQIVIYQDSVHILANEAEDIIEMVNASAYGDWLDASVEAARALLSGPLRIRVRRSLFGHHGTGAIQLMYDGQRRWCGDGLACLGIGTVMEFEDWFVRAGQHALRPTSSGQVEVE